MSQPSQSGESSVTPPNISGGASGVSGGGGTSGGGIQLEIDETYLSTYYGSISRVWSSGEEMFLDFSSGLKPKGPQQAKLPLEQRVVLSPWGAKRLLLSLAQVVGDHEKAFGPLKLENPAPMGAVASDGAKPLPGGGATKGA